jgi:adenosylmethionine-8-amino-7-oxononanoate aminotransferase
MLEQTQKISFVPMHLFSNEPAERLADELAKIAPPNLTTTWFVNSGSVGGHTFRRSKYMPLLKEMPHIPPAYCYHCWFNKDYPDCDIDCAMFLERVVKQEGAECVAAFIAELIVGATTGQQRRPRSTIPSSERHVTRTI